jgi:hypothetical protein
MCEGLAQFREKYGEILAEQLAPFLQVEIFRTDIPPIPSKVILPHRFIEAILISKVSRTRLRTQTDEKAIKFSVTQKVYITAAKMGPNFGISQTKHTPLPLFSTAIHNSILGMLTAKTGLPTYMVMVLFAMITDLANFFGREWPTIVEQRDIEIRFHSHAMGILRYNLEKAPAESAVLGSKRVSTAPGSVVMTFNVSSNNSPMKYGSTQIIPPALHSSLKGSQGGKPTVTFPHREMIPP